MRGLTFAKQKHKTKQGRRRFSSNTCIPLKIKNGFVDFSLNSFALERSNMIVDGSALGLVFVLISPR